MYVMSIGTPSFKCLCQKFLYVNGKSWGPDPIYLSFNVKITLVGDMLTSSHVPSVFEDFEKFITFTNIKVHYTELLSTLKFDNMKMK